MAVHRSLVWSVMMDGWGGSSDFCMCVNVCIVCKRGSCCMCGVCTYVPCAFVKIHNPAEWSGLWWTYESQGMCTGVSRHVTERDGEKTSVIKSQRVHYESCTVYGIIQSLISTVCVCVCVFRQWCFGLSLIPSESHKHSPLTISTMRAEHNINYNMWYWFCLFDFCFLFYFIL